MTTAVEKLTALTVSDEVLAEKGPTKMVKTEFYELAGVIANDKSFVVDIEKQNGPETIVPSDDLRMFLKDVIIAAGIDKKDAEQVMTADFTIPTKKMDKLISFVNHAILAYMRAGYRYEFPKQKDLEMKIGTKLVLAGTEEVNKKAPAKEKGGEMRDLGMFRNTWTKHYKGVVKSATPQTCKTSEAI